MSWAMTCARRRGFFALSPDWQKIYAKNGADVGVWDPQSGKRIDTLQDKQQTSIRSLVLSSDGSALITTAGRAGGLIWDTSTKKATAVAGEPVARFRCVVARTRQSSALELANQHQVRSADRLTPTISTVRIASGKNVLRPHLEADQMPLPVAAIDAAAGQDDVRPGLRRENVGAQREFLVLLRRALGRLH